MDKDPLIQFWAHMLDEAMEDKCLILEDREGKNINKAEDWINANCKNVLGGEIDGYPVPDARAVTIKVRKDIAASRLPFWTDAQGNRKRIRLGNGDEQWKGTCKYLLGTCRLYLVDIPAQEAEGKDRARLKARLNMLVHVIATRFDGDFAEDDRGRNFDGMSLKELEGKYGPEADRISAEEKAAAQAAASGLVRNPDYEIVRIDSFEQASEYGDYVSWCVTHDESMYEDYTYGMNRFYFVLKRGFKSLNWRDPQYRESMLAVRVDTDGNMTPEDGCTPRTNDGGSYMTPEELQELLGVDFYKTFKPYSEEEVLADARKNALPPDEFCRKFGCMRFDGGELHRGFDPTKLFRYKMMLNGKLKQVYRINDGTIYADGKFMAMSGGRLVPTVPETIRDCAFAHSDLAQIDIPKGVRSIGAYAFMECDALRMVSIPDSVESIGELAFFKCYALSTVTGMHGVKTFGAGAFEYCSRLYYIDLPDGIQEIPPSMFSQSGLAGIRIPDSVRTIGKSAFNECASIRKPLEIPGGVKTVGEEAFRDCGQIPSVTICEGVQSIGKYAFKSCEHMQSISIPGSVTSIGDGAFSMCYSLEKLEMPGSGVQLGEDVFANCQNLPLDENGFVIVAGHVVHYNGVSKDVVIPAGVTHIDQGAFYYNPRVQSVVIPDGVVSIGAMAFSRCENLSDVAIPDSVEFIDRRAFAECGGLSRIKLPPRLKRICDGTFQQTSLEEITIPGSASVIEYGAFSFCHNLERVVIQDGVKTIGYGTFASSHSLETVVVPKSVQHIEENVFNNVYLKNLIFKGRTMGDVQRIYGYPWGQRQDSIKPELMPEL